MRAAIRATALRTLSGLNRIRDLKVRQQRTPTTKIFYKRLTHTPCDRSRMDSGRKQFQNPRAETVVAASLEIPLAVYKNPWPDIKCRALNIQNQGFKGNKD